MSSDTDGAMLGICEDCAGATATTATPIPLAEYLDRFTMPILVMTDDVRVAGFNEAASKMLGSKSDVAIGRFAGQVIECEYAQQANGCGGTEHCKACAIRRAVLHTHMTGENLSSVTAEQRISTGGGTCPVRFLVSTEKSGHFVLLRIDAIKLKS
jgi:PAS domain-containing protein